MRSWKPHGGKVQALAFSPDGRTLATAGGADPFVCLWDALSGAEVARLDGHAGPVTAVEFGPDGRHLASVGRDGPVLVWDAENPARPVVRLDPEMASAAVLAFAPDGGRLVAAGEFGVAWWDASPMAPLSTPRPPTGREGRQGRGRLNCARYTPDGSRFLVGATDLEVWWPDLATPFAFIKAYRPTGVEAVAVAPDGGRVAFAVWNAVMVFRLADRARETTLHWGKDAVTAVAFARDGRSLLTAGADGTVRFWDAAAWRETRRLDWRIGGVRAVAFSPDGLTCAAGGGGGQVVVWDVDV